MKMRLLGAAIFLATAWTTPAWSCPPPLPEPHIAGETDQDYNARLARQYEEGRRQVALSAKKHQAELWDNSQVIALGTIDRIKQGKYRPVHEGYAVRVKLKRVVKGSSKTKYVWFKYRPPTNSCDPGGGEAALYGKLGDPYVIFANASKISAQTVSLTVGKQGALDEKTKMLLEGASVIPPSTP